MICNNCDNDLKSEDKFCSQCGERVVKAADCYEPPCALDHGTSSSERVPDHGTSSSEQVPGKMSPEKLKERLHKFENEKVNFGIIGESAAGKSSFINLFFDLKDGDENCAKVGYGNTTEEPKTYFHPASNQLSITDFPGITAILTRDEFLGMVNLSDYDYFFIFFKDALSETDAWIAKQLTDRKIPFSFVKAKVDTCVLEEKEKKGIDAENAIENLRKHLSEKHQKLKFFKKTKLYLISNIKKYLYMGDFVKLVSDIADILPDVKSEAFILYLTVLCPEFIEMKYRRLLKRVTIAAALSGGVAAIPIPGLDMAVKVGIVGQEIRNYARVFELDKPHAKIVPNLKHMMFQEDIGNMTCWKFIATQSLRALSKISLSAAISELDIIIPVVGSIIAACGNAGLVGACLLSNLNVLKSDALTVYFHYRGLDH